MTSNNIDDRADIEKFLEGNQPVAFSVQGNKQQRYRFACNILVKFNYLTASKSTKGLLKCFIAKITGYSRPQVTRLIKQY